MKGHSERISNKNIKVFNGKPLYHYVLNTLLTCENIKNAVINTDSIHIKTDVIKNFNNVGIIERPLYLQGDFVEMNNIIAYDLNQIDVEFFLQTHSTNPLLTSSTINNAINVFFQNMDKYDSLFSVTRKQSRFYDKNGTPINHNPNELLRTQDLPQVYEENSCLYIFSKTSFKKAGNKRIGLKPYMFEIDKLEAVDIDDAEDFIIAEALMKIRNEKT